MRGFVVRPRAWKPELSGFFRYGAGLHSPYTSQQFGSERKGEGVRLGATAALWEALGSIPVPQPASRRHPSSLRSRAYPFRYG